MLLKFGFSPLFLGLCYVKSLVWPAVFPSFLQVWVRSRFWWLTLHATFRLVVWVYSGQESIDLFLRRSVSGPPVKHSPLAQPSFLSSLFVLKFIISRTFLGMFAVRKVP